VIAFLLCFRKQNDFYYLTASLRDLPALNLGTVLAEILILAPVRGLTPMRAALLETLKVPKPVKVIFSPLIRALVIVSIIALTASAACFLESQTLATASISSSLVMALAIISIGHRTTNSEL